MTSFVETAAGDRVAYDSYGEGSAVVFVAGAGPSRETDPITTQTAKQLAGEGFTAIVYDRLGRGESLVDGPIHLDRELEALGALLQLTGPAVLVGHSSGCAIALKAAVDGMPVAGLVLWEAPIGAIVGGAQPWSDELGRRIDAGALESAQEHYMKDMPPEWLEAAKNSPAWPVIVQRVVSLRADAEALGWAESAGLGGIHVPVAVLVGEDTVPGMTESAQKLAAAIPGATRATRPGKNHAWEPLPMAQFIAGFAKG